MNNFFITVTQRAFRDWIKIVVIFLKHSKNKIMMFQMTPEFKFSLFKNIIKCK